MSPPFKRDGKPKMEVNLSIEKKVDTSCTRTNAAKIIKIGFLGIVILPGRMNLARVKKKMITAVK